MTAIDRHSSGSVARAIGLYTLAVLILSVMDALIKWLSADYPTVQIVFFRTTFGMVPMAFLVVRAGGIAVLRTRRWGAHLVRGLAGLGAIICIFYAFGVMPLADAYAIAFAAPLVMTALSVPMLGETVGMRRWAAVAVGFLGVVVMLRPGAAGLGGMLEAGALAAMAGTVFYAIAVIMIRRLSRTETTPSIMFHGGLVTVVGSAALLPFGFVMPNAADFLLLVCVGLLGGVGIICFTEALRRATVAILAPFDYSAMIWAVVLGYAIWHDLPDGWTLAGSAIVIASGLYILHRETRRGTADGAVPRAVPAPADTTPAP